MQVPDPDTGKMANRYPTKEYRAEMEAFYKKGCDHKGPTELRIFTARNGAQHFRYQCLSCGDPVGQSVPKASVKEDNLRPFDQNIIKSHNGSRNKEKDEIIRKHIKLQSQEDVRLSREYKEYLNSGQWAEKRRKILKRSGGLCEGCMEARATDVHHLTYDHMFDEFLFELVALCHSCHARLHQTDDPAKWEEAPCCGCRFQDEDADGRAWCFVNEMPALAALSQDGPCGPGRKSFEPLK